MEFLWFGDRGYPVLMFPTSMGRFYQYEDFGTVRALWDKISSGALQLVCVDSVDAESFYNEWISPAERIRRQDQYDRYLRDELVPYVQRHSGRPDMATYGCSFGGYHAANFAGRHPDVITKAVCFSGIYDVYRWLDGYWDDLCYYHTPSAYIANMNADWIHRLNGIDWVIATGEGDSLYQNNVQFAELLRSKGIRNHAEFWPGIFGHDWPHWNEAAPRLL